jgi:hypothetical protein
VLGPNFCHFPVSRLHVNEEKTTPAFRLNINLLCTLVGMEYLMQYGNSLIQSSSHGVAFDFAQYRYATGSLWFSIASY